MIKAVIYDTEIEAKQADWEANSLTGSVAKYKYSRKTLTATTTLTRAEYAALNGIPATYVDDNDIELPNPAYQALDASYTLNKCGLCVGDAYDVVADDGTVTVPDYVVDITDMIFVSEGV